MSPRRNLKRNHPHPRLRALREALDSCREEIVQLTSDLVALPTENPPGAEYPACRKLLKRKLMEMGLEYEQHGECLLGYYGKGEKTLYFHGHYDVVPAQDRGQFKPYVKGSHLFGRGSSDMKSGLAAMIYAVQAIQKCGIRLAGRIGLCLVPDEETGGARGSQYLARAGLLGRQGIGMLTPEPTSGVIWNANRGAISLRVTVRGKSAHVGLQHQGVNAFEKMLPVVEALMELKRKVETRRTAFKTEPKAAGRSILMMGGRTEGGTGFNTVPAECSFTVDRRINPEENLEREKEKLMTLFDRLRKQGIDLEVEVLQEGRAAGVSEKEPLAEALKQSVEAVTGKTPAFAMCPGLLEIRFYAQQGIPALAYGPGLLAVSHGPREFVPLENIQNCAAIYALTAARFLSAD